MDEFVKSRLSQADLARRLGRGTDVVCRLLGGPGNWTLDTISDLLFAISGAAPVFGVEHPLNSPPRNQLGPDWLHDGTAALRFPSSQVDTANKQVKIDAPRTLVTFGTTQ